MTICSVSGCDVPVRARGWCNPHYRAWLTKGDPLAPDGRRNPRRTPEHIEKLRTATVARNKARAGQSASAETRRRMSEAHTGLRHAPETRARIGETQRGKRGNSWKGEEVGYAALHDRLVSLRGKPTVHQCAHCPEQAAEWAYDHTDPDEKISARGLPYSPDVTRYLPLCRSCHRRFDHAR